MAYATNRSWDEGRGAGPVNARHECAGGPRRAFTLIELMVVMGIAGLMMAFGIPAFQNLGRQPAMNAAIAQLRSTVHMGRQWAITRRESTYIVFPMDEPEQYDGTPEGAYAYRSFNLFTFSEGYLREWTRLPQGIVFNPEGENNWGSAVGTNIFSPGYGWMDFDAFTLPQPNLICYPDGKYPRAPGGAYPQIFLMEGFLDEDGVPRIRPGENPLLGGLRIYTYSAGITTFSSY